MKLLIYFLYIFNAMLNSSGIKKMIMLREGFEIITLQRGNIENNTIIFLKFYLSLTHMEYVCIM
jgi:hypothetical protein